MILDPGQRVPGVKHRGATHTIWFAIGVGILIAAAGVLVGLPRGALEAFGTGLFAARVETLTVLAHILTLKWGHRT